MALHFLASCGKTVQRGSRPGEVWVMLPTQNDLWGESSNIISNKRRAKENFHLLLDAGGNLVTKNEEKAEVPNAFFASVFNSSPDTQPPEQEDRDGEQKETPRIQGEMVSDLLHHIDMHKSVGPDGIHPRVLKELPDVLAE